MIRGWIRHNAGGFSLESRLEAAAGSILVLFGASGSGKSLTLKAIAGLIRPREGRIEIGERVVLDHERGVWLPAHLRRVGYVPQDYQLFPHLDVAGNIAYGLNGKKAAEGKERVGELVQQFEMQGMERRRVWELSGGQRQRVAVARALASTPAALLLDEPFAALDTELRRSLRTELRDVLRAAGVPVVLVTHDKEEALAMGDAVVVMDNGRVSAQGEPVEVLGHPTQSRVARLTGVENLIEMTVEETHSMEGTMTCARGVFRLEAPLSDARWGQKVTLGIRASDIILASEEPKGLSARNRLPGRVVSVEAHGAGYEVTLDCGAPLRCHVTQGAIRELGIKPGAQLWAVIKASSIFLVG
ncbi:MAG: molybdenum ABC transporter ATP-binding protein [SAR202 cluster bacterium]|nr:molybdenum ABC transporter ATP-binding protein [SAR202 cluster bacterium]